MYEDTSKQHLDKRIRIKDGDLTYHEQFKTIKTELKKLIGDDAIYIEHVGTTSATDITAYPVIDIAISVTNEKNRERIAKKLEAIPDGNFHRAKSHNDEILVRKGARENPDYYLHIAVTDSDFYQGMVHFAKELKVNPKTRNDYENVHFFAKHNYYNSPDKYFYAKSQSIQQALGRHKVKYRNEEINVELVPRSLENSRIYRGVSTSLIKASVFVIMFGVFHTFIWACGYIGFNYVSIGGVLFYNILPGILFAIATAIIAKSVINERTEPFLDTLKWITVGLGAISALFSIFYGIFTLL